MFAKLYCARCHVDTKEKDGLLPRELTFLAFSVVICTENHGIIEGQNRPLEISSPAHW